MKSSLERSHCGVRVAIALTVVVALGAACSNNEEDVDSGSSGNVTAQIERVSVGPGGVEANGASYAPSVSSDGRYVAFSSYAGNLVADDTNGFADVFVYDRSTGNTTLLSNGLLTPAADGDSSKPSIDGSGRFVAFVSEATNLIFGDSNGAADVYLHDLWIGTTVRISVSSAGLQSNGDSFRPVISRDGSAVAYSSIADNLVATDTNAAWDVFVRDLVTNQTTLVSINSNGTTQGNADSHTPSLSGTGDLVAFDSDATSLASGGGPGSNVFLHDRTTATTTHVSRGFRPAISDDGRVVAFASDANLTPGGGTGTTHVYARGASGGGIIRVSETADGTVGNASSFAPAISGSGRLISFYSGASNLTAAQSGGNWNILVHDLATRETRMLTEGAVGPPGSYVPSMTIDGDLVAFLSDATNLVVDDDNGAIDIFVGRLP